MLPLKQMMIKVSIVEDDERTSQALKTILDGTPGFRCLSTHATAEEALKELPVEKVDVVLTDLSLPRMSGIECLRRLKESRPKLLLMVLTVHEDAERIFQSLEAGATAYMLKRTPPAQIIEAISELVEGGSPMSPAIARKVVQSFERPQHEVPQMAQLTGSERLVLERLMRGELYKEIADALKISAHTVRNHIHHIYEKLQVKSREEAEKKLRGPRRWLRAARP